MVERISQAVLDKLTAEAKASPRLRMNLDLRNSSEDQSQRMLNAIEPGSPLPIHRHQHTSETVVVLRGRLVWEYYEEVRVNSEKLIVNSDGVKGSCDRVVAEASEFGARVQKVQEIELSPNGQVVALNILAGQWHTVRALESGSVILEMKAGAYEPIGPEDILSM